MARKSKKTDRKTELSDKFLVMGKSLIKEGNDVNDLQILQAGNFMVLLAGIILEEKDSLEFGNLCAMFSAKKLMENMSGFGSIMDNEDFLRKMLGLDNS